MANNGAGISYGTSNLAAHLRPRSTYRSNAFIKSLMPDSISKAVLNYLNIFASKAARISAVGGVFLFVTSLALIFSIDRTFNTIWRVRRPRSFFKRLITYWAAITVGPLMIGASITLTTVLFSQASKGTDGWLDSLEWLFNIFPLIFSVAAFALLYRMLPAKPVRWNDALAGGLIAGIAFEIAKRLFALFIAKFPTYTAVYGAFAAVPIFLLWVYLSWLIILFGAAVFHLMTHAFFKALLFLAAGSVIIGMHHEQDMRRMGGLRKYMPITYWNQACRQCRSGRQ